MQLRGVILFLGMVLFGFTGRALDVAQTTDLRKIDFLEMDEMPLDSGWIFHWGKLINPDEALSQSGGISIQNLTSWTELEVDGQKLPSFGVATYVIHLVPPDSEIPLSLHLPKINSSVKLWINNQVVYEAGKVGLDKQNTLHRRREGLVPIGPGLDTLQITVQVANFFHRHGGLTKAPSISKTAHFWNVREYKIISDMMLIGCLVFMGLSLLVLHTAYWTNDKSVLSLAIFCLCWGYRILSDDYAILVYLFEEIRWVWLVKVEYLSLFVGSYFGLQYLRHIFSKSFPKAFRTVLRAVLFPFIGLTLILPGLYVSYLLMPFFVCALGALVYVLGVLMTSGRQRAQSIFGLVGIFSGLLVATYHLLSFNVLGEANSLFINLGYFAALMINSLLLAKRFSVSYFYMDKLQKDALIKNYEITQRANILSKTKDVLEEQVALRTRELEQVVVDLKERNNHLVQFNYIVSHNMKGPVANIIGLTNIYNRENSQDPFNPITIGKISESIHALDGVLNDLTKALRVNQKAGESNEEVDFEDLLDKIRKSIMKEIQDGDVDIQLDLEVNTIVSNRVYWYSILLNLISNAIKYRRSDVDSYIKIRTRREKDKQVRVVIEDNGLGIDLESKGKDVFGLYKRFHDHVEGKGMGLFMVKTQVESLGGEILIQSEPNVGTTFSILL